MEDKSSCWCVQVRFRAESASLQKLHKYNKGSNYCNHVVIVKSEHRRVQDVADLSPQQMKVLMGVSSIKLYCLTAHTPQYNLPAARFEDKYLIKTKL